MDLWLIRCVFPVLKLLGAVELAVLKMRFALGGWMLDRCRARGAK